MSPLLAVLMLALAVVVIRWHLRALNRCVIEAGGRPLRWPRLRWMVLALVLVLSAGRTAQAFYFCCPDDPGWCAYFESDWVRWWIGCPERDSGAR